MSQPAVRHQTPVPFLDLRTVHSELADAILDDLAALIESNAFTNGPAVAEFEQAFADYCGVGHCVGLASGLDALRLALIAAGIEPGERVIVPAQTFVATFEAVTQAGGLPVPVDVSEADYNLDVDATAAALDGQTRFVIPVHLYGQLADVVALASLGVNVIEDAAQAHGARRDGRVAGAAGHAAAFSFYPGKNLGAMGDAGALLTNDAELAAVVRALREHGQTTKYRHEREGWTARLDTIQAVVLLRKLPHLDRWNEERRRAAAWYTDGLAGIGDLQLPPVPAGSDPVWHLYVVRSARRDQLADFLREHGVGTGIHYPEPPHLTAAYAHLGYTLGSFPRAEAMAQEVLSLPIFPGITEEQVTAVVESVAAFFGRG